jgi:LysR family transcriptional regulator, glycine cleavage system transcriptional activator
MRTLPTASSLLAFEAAARTLSFVRVAREMNVTPGAVSRQIQSLEAHLGARLFVRHHRRVELTPVGREYLAEIGPALARITAVSERIRGASSRGALSICAYPTFAIRWLLPRWGRFYDRYPDIDVRLTTSLNPVDFVRDDYDLAIEVVREGQDRAALTAHKLIDVVVFPVCSPRLARQIRVPGDVSRQVLVHSAPRPLDWQRWMQTAGVDGVDWTRGLRFESLNLAIQAAIEGIGVAMGVEALVGEDLERGRLVRPLAVSRRSGSPFHVVHHETRAADAKVIAFRDWLLEEAATLSRGFPSRRRGRAGDAARRDAGPRDARMRR